MDYSKFISPIRRSVETPKDLIKDGKAVFGTFDKEFETMDLVSTIKPTALPSSFNKSRLTLWEACEIHLKEGLLLVALSDMALFGITKMIFFDYRTRKVYSIDNTLKSKDTIIAPNLINGSRAFAETKNSRVEFINNFDKGMAKVSGSHLKDDDYFEYLFELKKLSNPSVVSIPFGDNRPLYTEKMFFEAKGYLRFNDELIETDSESCAIIDDHRGFYPRKAHYDWLTSMGKIKVNGKDEWIAFNLTRNQSIDQEKYNENLIWKEGRSSLLPPVTFTKDKDVKALLKGERQTVHVKDEHGMVDLVYEIEACSPMITHALIVKIDYYVTFGRISGFLIDEDGTKYEFDKAEAIGEDKTLLL